MRGTSSDPAMEMGYSLGFSSWGMEVLATDEWVGQRSLCKEINTGSLFSVTSHLLLSRLYCVVTQRFSQALRDVTTPRNGCEGDYVMCKCRYYLPIYPNAVNSFFNMFYQTLHLYIYGGQLTNSFECFFKTFLCPIGPQMVHVLSTKVY